MNIKIEKLFESQKNKSELNEIDLFTYLDSTFPDNAKSWKNATMEPVDMANWIYETVKETVSEEKAKKIEDKTKSKTPKEWNKKHKKRIKDGFPMLSDYNKKSFFSQFGHWITNFKNLNESQQIKIDDEKEIEDVLKLKINQFTFDCGLFMGTINSGLNNKFGLLYHAENTTNLGFFLSSVDNFIANSGNSLSSDDIEKLTNHYVKYYYKK
jgi:hypothetical protein